MTLGEAMTRVERLRPDAYGEEIMAGWLSELDGKYRLSLAGKASPVPHFRIRRRTPAFSCRSKNKIAPERKSVCHYPVFITIFTG